MEKYSYAERAVENAKNMLTTPAHLVKDFSVSTYTCDHIVVKTDSIGFPPEVISILREGGVSGIVEGANILWASSKRRFVLWNFSSSLVHETDIRMHQITSVYAIHPRSDVFVSSIHTCLLLFTEREVSLMCLCSSPVAFVDMEMTAALPVQIGCVCETYGHKVLLGGVDGNIYEFVYDKSSWFGGRQAKVVCHTSGMMSHLFPFLYAVGKRSAVAKIVKTKLGALVLYEDGMLDSFEYSERLRRERVVDLSGLKLKSGDKVELHAVDGGGYEAFLVLPGGKRAFLDGGGRIVGMRELPAMRAFRARANGEAEHVTEGIYSAGKHMVVIGKKEQENTLTVVSPNKAESPHPENSTTVNTGAPGYKSAVAVSIDPIGRPPCNSVEALLRGQSIGLVGADKIDIYQVLDGLDIMERSGTHPEGLFSFRQRSGTAYSFLCSLYAVSLGVESVSINNIFRKSTSMHREVISLCAGIIVSSIWDTNVLTIVEGPNRGVDQHKYLEEVERAIEKLERVRKYVERESPNMEHLIIAHSLTVVDMIKDIVETLHYINILMETDASHIIRETARRMKKDLREFPGTLQLLLAPKSPQRKISLELLVDLYLAQNMSIETVADTLNEKCPVLFSVSNALLLRGQECLEKAQRATTEEDKKWYLKRSLGFFQKTSLLHIPDVVKMYLNVNYPIGVVIVLKGAFQNLDREDAVHYLSKVRYTEEILTEGLKDNRPLFCSAMLDAVVVQIKDGTIPLEILLKVRSSYLEEYLEMLDRTSTDIGLCDLVWKYHVKNGNYKTAALYLFRTAERKQPFITLQKRIEYLAIACTMQGAGGSQKALVTGPIREFVPKLGSVAKERLDMAQKQADVMALVAGIYTPGEFATEESERIEQVFGRLEMELLGYQELFDICVMFGFSLLALKISGAGVVEDQMLLRQLWEDVLSGGYENCLHVLENNKSTLDSTTVDVIMDILIKKQMEATGPLSMPISEVLMRLGYSTVSIARALETKAQSLDHAPPAVKKAILEEGIRFCESQNLVTIVGRLADIKASLGL